MFAYICTQTVWASALITFMHTDPVAFAILAVVFDTIMNTYIFAFTFDTVSLIAIMGAEK